MDIHDPSTISNNANDENMMKIDINRNKNLFFIDLTNESTKYNTTPSGSPMNIDNKTEKVPSLVVE